MVIQECERGTMAVGKCSRCGREGNVEYATDGLPYCSSCIFYGNYKQCWRCRMYLPAAELQQYKGNWVCPYCLIDLKEEEKKLEKPQKEYKPEKYPIQPLSYGERCERCGREAETLYIWNGKKLCSSCLAEEQKKWTTVSRGPGGAPIVVGREKREGLLSLIIGRLLEFIGLRKRKQVGEEIVAQRIEKVEKENKERPVNVVSFKHGKPLSEELKREEVKEEEQKEKKEGMEIEPQTETLIQTKNEKGETKKKKRRKKKTSRSRSLKD